MRDKRPNPGDLIIDKATYRLWEVLSVNDVGTITVVNPFAEVQNIFNDAQYFYPNEDYIVAAFVRGTIQAGDLVVDCRNQRVGIVNKIVGIPVPIGNTQMPDKIYYISNGQGYEGNRPDFKILWMDLMAESSRQIAIPGAEQFLKELSDL